MHLHTISTSKIFTHIFSFFSHFASLRALNLNPDTLYSTTYLLLLLPKVSNFHGTFEVKFYGKMNVLHGALSEHDMPIYISTTGSQQIHGST